MAVAVSITDLNFQFILQQSKTFWNKMSTFSTFLYHIPKHDAMEEIIAWLEYTIFVVPLGSFNPLTRTFVQFSLSHSFYCFLCCFVFSCWCLLLCLSYEKTRIQIFSPYTFRTKSSQKMKSTHVKIGKTRKHCFVCKLFSASCTPMCMCFCHPLIVIYIRLSTYDLSFFCVFIN